MATKNYIKYARKAYYEPQSLYLASGSSYEVCDELRRLGAKRVLFVCNKTISKYKNFSDLQAGFEKIHFRVFPYVRSDGPLKSSDILSGLQVYKEYNCDTIVTVGGSAEIDCGKIISAMYTNDVVSPTDIVGLDKIKKDISLVCCIVTDNSSAASSSYAEFLDENTSKWSVALSAYLIPQVVVIDTDIAMRTDINIALDCALTSLGIAIEAYLSPVASEYPEYRANAVDSCRSLMKYIDLMMESPDESYYRRRVAVAGLAAGLASRITGLGLSHIASHMLMSKFGSIRSFVYLYIISCLLSESDEQGLTRAADLARQIGLIKEINDNQIATEKLMEFINQYMSYYTSDELLFNLGDKEINNIVSEVFKETEIFGFDNKAKGSLGTAIKRIAGKC